MLFLLESYPSEKKNIYNNWNTYIDWIYFLGNIIITVDKTKFQQDQENLLFFQKIISFLDVSEPQDIQQSLSS